MLQTLQHIMASGFLDKESLAKLKTKAIRAGLWFRALPRIDRVLVDLTIRVADTVRSPHLARSILSVVGKLEDLFEGKLQRAVREFGFPFARKLSLIAQGWGNVAAREWGKDAGYAHYWAAMKLNGALNG